ncbi:ABC transporter ATP-binding protein [Vallitalea sediminicola]
MLEAINIEKEYRIRKGVFAKDKMNIVQAVKQISLQIKPGEIVGLLGINGAGKTTTIKMLSTLIEPTRGTIVIDGINAVESPKEVRKIINMIVGGERNIYLRLTPQQNLEYFAALYNIPRKNISSKIEELINLVGLTKSKDIPVETFSKGMKQRLQIARGLINNPKYLYLDEPTLGLDINIAKEIRSYVRKMAKDYNKGILLTTHYIKEAEELCDKIYVIDKGELILEGTSEEIKSQALNNIYININVTNINKNAENILKNLVAINHGTVKFEVSSAETLIRICSHKNIIAQITKVLVEQNIKITNIKFSEPNLEDALIKLIDGGKQYDKIN